MADTGIVFAATGEAYVSLARRAARTVRQHMPDIEIDLFTGPKSLEDPVFSQIHLLNDPSRRPKMEALRRSRFRRTLYLDCDVVMVGDVSDVFDLLDHFDLVAAHEQFGSSPISMARVTRDLPPAFRQINSGVLGIRKSDATDAFLDRWKQMFTDTRGMLDQPVLREVLFDSDLRFWILPPEYNQMYPPFVRFSNPLHMAPRLFHLTFLHEEPWHAETPERPYMLRDLLTEPAFEAFEARLKSDRTLGNAPRFRHAAGETLRRVPRLYRLARWAERSWRNLRR